MGAEFHISVEGRQQVEQRLALLQARFGDLTPLMDIIGTVIESDTADNFAGEHGPDGTPWKPSQRVLRTAVGPQGPQAVSGKTLQLSRRMALSVTHLAGPTQVEVGTNVIYARRHQEGFDGTETVRSHKRTIRQAFGIRLASPVEVIVGSFSRKANTPARPFIGLSAGARDEIEHHAAAYAGAEA